MDLILNHFKTTDPKIHQILQKMNQKVLSTTAQPVEYFNRLTESIIGQQLSVKVARVINDRFKQLFDNTPVLPEHILQIEDQKLRDIGMSWGKVKYVKDLAQKTNEGVLKFEKFPQMTDEEIIAELTKIKGIGRWTAEMFLIFDLGREDVFSFGDLGLRRAIEKIYQFDKDTHHKHFEKIVEKWKPYRSYASLALWHSLDNKPQ